MQTNCIDEKAVLNPGIVLFALSAVLVQATWLQRSFCVTDTLEATLSQDSSWYLQIPFAVSKALM